MNTSPGPTPFPASAHCFNRVVLSSSRRLCMPIAVYPGLALTGATVRQVVTNAASQFEAAAALHERYATPFVLSAMDLSVEAEVFGSEICFPENEVPFVVGRRITTVEQARGLAIPTIGDGRTAVVLDTVQRLKQLSSAPLVLGGCIGPFSLVARLVGVSEALELTATEPGLVQVALEKCGQFLVEYARAFRRAGARALLMAEPAAGLLSPRSMAAFSSTYIKQIAATVADVDFAFILHNCAAKLVHLPSMLATGVGTLHVGAPMDLPAALGKVPPDVVLCGNLDPAGVFLQSCPANLKTRARELLSTTARYRNYLLSSGCDVPAGAPIANLDALYEAVQEQPPFHQGADIVSP